MEDDNYRYQVESEEEYYKALPLAYYIIRENFEQFEKELNSENSNYYYDCYLGQDKKTLLHLAIELKKEDFVRLLLQRGANPLKVQKTFYPFELDLIEEQNGESFFETFRGDCIYKAIEISKLENLSILKMLLENVKKSELIKKMRLEYLKYSLELDKKEIFEEILEFLNFNDKKSCLEELLISYINEGDKKNVLFISSSFYEELKIRDDILKYIEVVINKFRDKNLTLDLKENLLDIIKIFLNYRIPKIEHNLVFKVISTNYLPLIKIFEDLGINFNIITRKEFYKNLNLSLETFEYLLKNFDVNINKLFLRLCSNKLLNLLDCLINLKEIKNFENILIYAFEKENIKAIKALFLKRLIKINEIMNGNGETPLTLAVKKNNLKLIKFLLNQEELNVNMKNKEGKNALLMSILDNRERTGINASKRYELIDELLIKGADVNMKYGIGGNNTLMLAIIQNDVYLASKLLDVNIDINAQNFRGETALMLAIKNSDINLEDRIKIIRRLLKKEDINLDIRDKKGNEVLKLVQDLEISKFKSELINLLKLRKRTE